MSTAAAAERLVYDQRSETLFKAHKEQTLMDACKKYVTFIAPMLQLVRPTSTLHYLLAVRLCTLCSVLLYYTCTLYDTRTFTNLNNPNYNAVMIDS
jgi:hypothetical protein